MKFGCPWCRTTLRREPRLSLRNRTAVRTNNRSSRVRPALSLMLAPSVIAPSAPPSALPPCPLPHQRSPSPLSPPESLVQPLDRCPCQYVHVVAQSLRIINALALRPMTTFITTTRPMTMPYALATSPNPCPMPYALVSCHVVMSCSCRVPYAHAVCLALPYAMRLAPCASPHAPLPMRPCRAYRVASCALPLRPSPQGVLHHRHHRHATRVTYG